MSDDIARALGERIAQYVIRCIEFKNEEKAQGACREAVDNWLKET